MRTATFYGTTLTCRLEVVVLGVGSTGLAPTVAVQRLSDGLWLQAGGGSWGAGVATNPMVEASAANMPGLYEYTVPSARVDYSTGRQGYLVKYVEATTPLVEYETQLPQTLFSGEISLGLAAAALPAAVQLGAWAPALANFFANQYITIVGGTGAGQTRLITAYSALRVCTVAAWTTVPDVTSVCVIHAGGQVGISVADIFTASMSAYETAGTFGNHVNRILRGRQENMRTVYTDWSSHGQPTEGYILGYASAADLNGDADPWPLAKSRYDFTATYDGDLQLTGYESGKTL